MGRERRDIGLALGRERLAELMELGVMALDRARPVIGADEDCVIGHAEADRRTEILRIDWGGRERAMAEPDLDRTRGGKVENVERGAQAAIFGDLLGGQLVNAESV